MPPWAVSAACKLTLFFLFFPFWNIFEVLEKKTKTQNQARGMWQRGMWPLLPYYVQFVPFQKACWPWHSVITCVFVVHMFVSVSSPLPHQCHKSGNLVVFMLYPSPRAVVDTNRCLENVFLDESVEAQRHLWSLSEPKVESHLRVSPPSPEVLSALRDPGLGEERTGNVAEPRIGECCMGEESERLEAQGEPGEEREEGQGNGWGVESTGPVSGLQKASQAIPNGSGSIISCRVRQEQQKGRLLQWWSRYLWAAVHTASSYEDAHSHPPMPFGSLHFFLFFSRKNNRALRFRFTWPVIMATPQLLKSVLHILYIDSAPVTSVFISIANVNISVTCKDVFINSILLIFFMWQTHLSLC